MTINESNKMESNNRNQTEIDQKTDKHLTESNSKRHETNMTRADILCAF